MLVLNRLWQPVHICSVRRALVLLYLGHAQVVDSDGKTVSGTYDLQAWIDHPIDPDDGLPMVGTPSAEYAIPSIIVLSHFDRLPKREVKFTRENIFRRDDFPSQYCGERKNPRDLNIDHVIPRDKGGPLTWDNVVCSCIPCNTRKANKMPEQAGMIPNKTPKAPRWRPLAAGDQYHTGVRDERWSLFLCSSN